MNKMCLKIYTLKFRTTVKMIYLENILKLLNLDIFY